MQLIFMALPSWSHLQIIPGVFSRRQCDWHQMWQCWWNHQLRLGGSHRQHQTGERALHRSCRQTLRQWWLAEAGWTDSAKKGYTQNYLSVQNVYCANLKRVLKAMYSVWVVKEALPSLNLERIKRISGCTEARWGDKPLEHTTVCLSRYAFPISLPVQAESWWCRRGSFL